MSPSRGLYTERDETAIAHHASMPNTHEPFRFDTANLFVSQCQGQNLPVCFELSAAESANCTFYSPHRNGKARWKLACIVMVRESRNRREKKRYVKCNDNACGYRCYARCRRGGI